MRESASCLLNVLCVCGRTLDPDPNLLPRVLQTSTRKDGFWILDPRS